MMTSGALGHFPVRLNTTLKDKRYTILRKLGEGVSATTWLVRDAHSEPHRTYLAAKILTLEATCDHDTGRSRECEFMKEIQALEDREALPLLFDDFTIQGPQGLHLCLVMQPLSTSVSALRRSSPTKSLPVYMVQNIIHMVLEALQQLQALRIVHTDVKLDNILFANPFYHDQDMESFLNSNPVETEDGEIINSQPLPAPYKWDTSAFEAEKMVVSLVDFGHAQRAGEQPTAGCFSAPSLRAPEVILWSDFGPAVDIWAVGCLTFELLVGRWLFDPEDGGEEWSFEDDHLAKMMELTGQRFPSTMLQRAKRRKQYFDDEGNLLHISELIPVSLETAMANYKIPDLVEDDIKEAADFIRACLRFDYTERATAEELLNHPFLRCAFRC